MVAATVNRPSIWLQNHTFNTKVLKVTPVYKKFVPATKMKATFKQSVITKF